MGVLVSVATALTMVSCAARGVAPRLLAEMRSAGEQQDAGCYTCLAEALAIYERVSADPRAPEGALRGGFETAVMLTVRAKELGLPPGGWLARAERLAARLSADPTGLAPSAYVAAANAVVGETSGFDPEVRQQRWRRPTLVDGKPVPRPERAALDAAPASDRLAGYLSLALECDEAVGKQGVDADAMFARYGRTPAMRYRLAICGAAPAELVTLREADPRWTDTLLFEARRQMALRPVADLVKAVELFAAAKDAFPDSHAVVLSLAAAQHALGEFASALSNYDSVLIEAPTHRDALLGRLTSLSYLTRYVDAVAAATRLIDLGTWHIGDAYYWRAWNRYQLHQLPAAWDDVERASALLVNTAVYTLAGYIAYAQSNLDIAIDRFDRAYAMDRRNCEAVWYAGLVHVDRQAWHDAAPKFSTGLSCFTDAATEARAEIDAMAAEPRAGALHGRRLAAAQKHLETAEHRAAQSAFNAAQCFLRLAQKEDAARYVDRAGLHPLLREKATTLRAAIDKLPG